MKNFLTVRHVVFAVVMIWVCADMPAWAVVRSDCQAAGGFVSRSWSNTDFTRCTVDISEIQSGGPGKDGIPALDNPIARPIDAVKLDGREPVISVEINNKRRAYPLQILTWHEIANDELGGVPIAVTYCPLCNAAIVFDRRVDGEVLDFGTTGNLRNSDLVMYDRQSESWWQQYTGEAIFGARAGQKLRVIPARLESWQEFIDRVSDTVISDVLVPNNTDRRNYGVNPYVGYDQSAVPFLYRGETPKGIAPLARVVVVDDQAWSLAYLRERKKVQQGDLLLSWRPGQASALDTAKIAEGRDIGTVLAQRDGKDVVYKVTFAFVWHAFQPDRQIIGVSEEQ